MEFPTVSFLKFKYCQVQLPFFCSNQRYQNSVSKAKFTHFNFPYEKDILILFTFQINYNINIQKKILKIAMQSTKNDQNSTM